MKRWSVTNERTLNARWTDRREGGNSGLDYKTGVNSKFVQNSPPNYWPKKYHCVLFSMPIKRQKINETYGKKGTLMIVWNQSQKSNFGSRCIQLRALDYIQASSYSYVFVILNMFPLEFWNKWYIIGKPLYRALWIRKKNWAWHHSRGGHAHLP